MTPMINLLSTPPAPSISALGATHMRASFILLNWCLTLRAFVSSYLVSPVFVQLLLGFLASFTLVPGNLALEADILLALQAQDFCGVRLCFNNILTVRVRTELLVL